MSEHVIKQEKLEITDGTVSFTEFSGNIKQEQELEFQPSGSDDDDQPISNLLIPSDNLQDPLQHETPLERKRRLGRYSSQQSEDGFDAENPSWKTLFHYLEDENKTECQICKKKLSGNHVTNNKRHFTSNHPVHSREYKVSIVKRKIREADDCEPTEKKMKKISRGEYIRNSVELVTIHAVPFQYMNYPATQRLNKGHQQSTGVTLNAANIAKYVEQTADEIRGQIRQETKNKMVSLKLDIGSRYGKSVLGVNIQFYPRHEKKIVVRTLGMIELISTHTAKKLESEIHKLLRLYSIDIRDIYTSTSDSGTNMLRLGELMRNDQEPENEDSDEEDEKVNDSFAVDNNSEIETEHEGITRELTKLFNIMTVVRCPCHFMNLAVQKTLKKINTSTTIAAVREVVKNLKGIKFKGFFQCYKTSLPRFDVETRWNSLYIMFASLLKIKEKLQSGLSKFAAKDSKDVEISEQSWEFIQKFCDAFKPAYEATLKLQGVQVPMSEFYVIWLNNLCNLRQVAENNDFADEIIKQLSLKSPLTMENLALKAAIYMDPRFNFDRSTIVPVETQKEIRAFLVKTALRIQANMNNLDLSSFSCETTSSTSKSPAELLFEESLCATPAQDISDKIITEKIICISQQKRQPFSMDPFIYYEQFRDTDPLLCELAMTVFSAPATQVSVERSFSALKILITHTRTNLKSSNINNVLVVSLNRELLNRIDFESMVV